MAEWYSVATPDEVQRLVGAWDDAPIENEELCALILETAKEQVLEYAPALGDGETVVVDGYVTTLPPTIPNRWVFAQLKQAENLWNAGRVSGGGEGGAEQFTFTPRPLDKTIRAIIRPVDGKPHVL